MEAGSGAPAGHEQLPGVHRCARTGTNHAKRRRGLHIWVRVEATLPAVAGGRGILA